MSETYIVHAASVLPPISEGLDHPAWTSAETALLDQFRPESTDHRPHTRVKLLHGSEGIRGVFQIDDQYVRSIRTGYQDAVCKDSCVEFFIQPRGSGGYFSLEMNAGGAYLFYYIEDPARARGGFKKFTSVPAELGRMIRVRSSLPARIEPEIGGATSWELNFFLPFTVLTHYAGPLGNLSGQRWRGNFFKCGDETSHPHWASWSPVDELNFHLPRCFGEIRFE